MDPKDIILHGDNSQKANQLMALLKDRQLSPEQLALLVPQTKVFLVELGNAIKRQTEIDKCNYDKIIEASLEIIDKLIHSMREVSTESERLNFLYTIDRIHARMVEIQKNEKDNNGKNKSIFAILGGILIFILLILSAGTIRIGKESKS